MTKKIKLKISSRLLKKRNRRQTSNQPKQCRFCGREDESILLDYKNTTVLHNFLTERGKILPSRISGNCAYHQRALSTCIKLSRVMALLPYTSARY